jgi:hypothetical protein
MTSPRAPVSGMCVSSLMVLKIGVLPDVRGSAALRETPSPLNHTLPFLAFSITSKWTPMPFVGVALTVAPHGTILGLQGRGHSFGEEGQGNRAHLGHG